MAGVGGFKIPNLSHSSGIFPLFGLPFAIIGFSLLSSPYWMLRKAKKTVYVVTDKRAIVLAGGAFGSTTIRSFDPNRLKDIERIQKKMALEILFLSALGRVVATVASIPPTTDSSQLLMSKALKK